MSNFHISFMEQNDIQKSVKVLSIAMLNNPHHIGVFLGNGENERLEIEKMFFELFNNLPGIVFLAKENEKIIGVMRMKSCIGKVIDEPDVFEDENDINWRKSVWFREWAEHDPAEQHWHLGPIGVLPSHRGIGIGTELMQRFCKEVDHCSAKAYLETDLDKKTDHIEVDLTQMQMMLAAILSNASEAMEGQGRVRITLINTNVSKKKCRKHPGLKPGHHVLLRLADNGKGMDEQTRNRIFEPFFTTKFQGRGLGMAAVYGIVKKHGGYVYVASAQGQGTTVSIYLPGVQAKEQVAEKTQTYVTKPNRTALIVEDEHLVMEVNRAIVEKLGYHVLEAKCGKEAIEIAQQYKGDIDFAMLDVILPDMDGSMIYPKLMEHRPDLLVVVCSGFALDGPARQILESGAQSYIQKPFTVAALSAVLNKIFKELNREE